MDDGTDGWMESFISSRRPLLYVISMESNQGIHLKNFLIPNTKLNMAKKMMELLIMDK